MSGKKPDIKIEKDRESVLILCALTVRMTDAGQHVKYFAQAINRTHDNHHHHRNHGNCKQQALQQLQHAYLTYCNGYRYSSPFGTLFHRKPKSS